MSVWEIVIRAIASFVGLLLWSRLLGKKLISQMTFFDFVAGVTMGSIGGAIILTNTIPLWICLVGLSTFVVCALLVDLVALRSTAARDLLDSEPLLVVRKGKVMEDGMRKARLTVEDLLMQMRKKNTFYLNDVEYAFFENDGTVSVLKKTDAMPVSNKDAQIHPAERGLPHAFIIDGKVRQGSLKDMNKDMAWVEQQLQAQGIDDVSKVVLAQADQQGQVYFDKRDDNVQPLH